MAELGEPLSDREQDVLEQVMQGASNKEIAQSLHISPNTVKVHLRNIYTKLDVSSRTEASMMAVERGLIDSFSFNDIVAQPDEDEDDDDLDGIHEMSLTAVPLTTSEPVSNHFTPQTNVAVTQLPASTTTPTVEPQPRSRFSWKVIIPIVSLIIIALAAALWWYGRQRNQSTADITFPAIVPFAPEQLATANWFRSLPMPQPRSEMATVSIGVDMYQIGGYVDGTVVDTVSVFSINTATWRAAARKPTAVADASAAELLEIYVPGGLTAENKPTAVVEAYSPTTDNWRAVQALPKPIAGGLTLSNGSSIFLFGGWDGSNYLRDAYRYDPITDNWQTLTPMQHARTHAAGGMLNGLLYVVGGYNGEDVLDICEYYNPISDSWKSCKPLSQAREDAGAAVVLNKLYVLGGESGSQIYGEVYDPSKDSWQSFSTPSLAVEETIGWRNPAVTNVEARIFVQGGRVSETQTSAEVLIYAPPVYQTYIPAASNSGEDEE